jgi:hypothetical protein
MTESLALATPADVPEPPDIIAVAQSKERDLLLRDIGSGLKLTKEQKAIFARQATYDVVDVLPTGEMYVSGNYWRALLSEAFDPGGWGVRPGRPQQHMHEENDRSILYREVFLVVSRCEKCLHSISACTCKTTRKARAVCLATAMGAQVFHPANSRMTIDDATEACTTNGIMRCCKVLGIYANLWDKAWAEKARAELCVKVQTRGYNNKVRDYWRRLDRLPLPGEFGLADGSLNANKYEAPAPPPQSPGRQQQPTPREAKHMPEAAPPASTGVLLLPGHAIKTIRVVNTGGGKLWVVSTDKAEFITFNEQLMIALENFRARGMRVDITTETITTERGPRESILEARPIRK